MAISMLDGRIYNRSCGAMKAYTWDGKTKYKITETEEEEKERLANWENFLKTEDSEK
jgi:HIV Tat-specific factor 1